MSVHVEHNDAKRLYFALKDVTHAEIQNCISIVHPEIVKFPEGVNGRILTYVKSVEDLRSFNIERGPYEAAVLDTIREWQMLGVPFEMLKRSTANFIPAPFEEISVQLQDEVAQLRSENMELQSTIASRDTTIAQLRSRIASLEQESLRLITQQSASLNTSTNSNSSNNNSDSQATALTSSMSQSSSATAFTTAPSIAPPPQLITAVSAEAELSFTSLPTNSQTSNVAAQEVLTQAQSSEDIINAAYYTFNKISTRETARQFVGYASDEDEDDEGEGYVSDNGTIGVDNGDADDNTVDIPMAVPSNVANERAKATPVAAVTSSKSRVSALLSMSPQEAAAESSYFPEESQSRPLTKTTSSGHHRAKKTKSGVSSAVSSSSQLEESQLTVSSITAVRSTPSNRHVTNNDDDQQSQHAQHEQQQPEEEEQYDQHQAMTEMGGGADDDDGDHEYDQQADQGDDDEDDDENEEIGGRDSDDGSDNDNDGGIQAVSRPTTRHQTGHSATRRKEMSRNAISDRVTWTQAELREYDEQYPVTAVDPAESSSNVKRPAIIASAKEVREMMRKIGKYSTSSSGAKSATTATSRGKQLRTVVKGKGVMRSTISTPLKSSTAAETSTSSHTKRKRIIDDDDDEEEEEEEDLLASHSKNHTTATSSSSNSSSAKKARRESGGSSNGHADFSHMTDREVLEDHVAKIGSMSHTMATQLNACKYVIHLFQGGKNKSTPLKDILSTGVVPKVIHVIRTRTCKPDEVKLLHAAMVLLNDVIGTGGVIETDLILAHDKNIVRQFVTHLSYQPNQDFGTIDQCLYFLGEVSKIQPGARQEILVKCRAFSAVVELLDTQKNMKSQHSLACTLQVFTQDEYSPQVSQVINRRLFMLILSSLTWLLGNHVVSTKSDRDAAIGYLCDSINQLTEALTEDEYLYLAECLLQSSLAGDVLQALKSKSITNGPVYVSALTLLSSIFETTDSAAEVNAILNINPLPVLSSLLPTRWPNSGPTSQALAAWHEVTRCLKFMSAWTNTPTIATATQSSSTGVAGRIVGSFTSDVVLVGKICHLAASDLADPDIRQCMLSCAASLLQHTTSTHSMVWLDNGALTSMYHCLDQFALNNSNLLEGEDEEEGVEGEAHYALEVLKALTCMVQRNNSGAQIVTAIATFLKQSDGLKLSLQGLLHCAHVGITQKARVLLRFI